MNDVSIVHSPVFHRLKCLLCAHTKPQHIQIHHFPEVVRRAICRTKCEVVREKQLLQYRTVSTVIILLSYFASLCL